MSRPAVLSERRQETGVAGQVPWKADRAINKQKVSVQLAGKERPRDWAENLGWMQSKEVLAPLRDLLRLPFKVVLNWG